MSRILDFSWQNFPASKTSQNANKILHKFFFFKNISVQNVPTGKKASIQGMKEKFINKKYIYVLGCMETYNIFYFIQIYIFTKVEWNEKKRGE